MSIEIKIPDIGSDVVEVTEILVNVGDNIAADQSVITVEGDKATIEVPASQPGIIKTILVQVGDKVETGTPMLVVDASQSHASSKAENKLTTQDATEASSQSAQALVEKEIAVPDIGGDEVEVTEILIKVGDTIDIDQSLIVVEGDKASMEVPAPAAGTIKSIALKTGDKVKTGTPMMTLLVSGAGTSQQQQATADKVTAEKVTAEKVTASKELSSEPTSTADISADSFVENSAYVHASPVIRRIAREFGVNLAVIKASGRKNRILKEDVQNYIKQAVKRAESSGAATSASLPGMLPWPKLDFSKFGEIEEVELGRIQKISGANLSRNWVMIPHVTHFDEADITELEDFRKQQNTEVAKQKLEVKITPVVFIMKAVAKALAAFPRFNSSLSADAQRLTLKKYIHIGVAVDTPNGLVVPVFRDVNSKGIIKLSQELMEISRKAREGKLSGSDMQGGCFTISSLGGLGTTAFTPIVNAPEVAILGVSRSSMKPVWNGTEFTPRLMLPLSLSFDHRVIDGAEAARFLSYLNQVLSDIRRLVM